MGVEPPYIYEKPSTYSFVTTSKLGSTTKGVTTAECWSPNESRPQSGTSFIKMEQTSKPKASKPMSASTKSRVKWWRVVLLNLRVCTLLGGVGLLFCAVVLKLQGGPVDWMIRIAPGVNVVHSLYGIYHLATAAKKRAPSSSSSYMMFSAMMDSLLILFLAFTAYLANIQMNASVKDPERWKTMFPLQFQTDTIIYAAWLVSIATGAAQICSLILSIYLAVLFKRISKLPPDMNPLEDNLTSRHKRNKSSISTLVPDPVNGSTSSDKPLIEKWPVSENASVEKLNSGLQRRSGPTLGHESQIEFQSIPYQPGSPLHAEQRGAPRTYGAGIPRGSPFRGPPNPQRFHASPAESALLLTPSIPKSLAPPELQYLRQARGTGTETSLPPSMATKNNLPFAQRSPKPLGMNPPTPRTTPAVPSAGTEYVRNPYRSPTREGRQALRDLVNAQGADGSPMTWEEVNLRPGKARRAEAVDLSPQGANSTRGGGKKGRFYGSLHGMISGKRTVSSGMDGGDEWGGMKRREVSGKVAEEGRSGMR